MRLLIAEDDPKLLKSLLHIFQSNHYAVDGVGDGSAAFECAVSGEYDGLVLDVMMPGMDGVTVLKRLRQKGITTPALFLTECIFTDSWRVSDLCRRSQRAGFLLHSDCLLQRI